MKQIIAIQIIGAFIAIIGFTLILLTHDLIYWIPTMIGILSGILIKDDKK